MLKKIMFVLNYKIQDRKNKEHNFKITSLLFSGVDFKTKNMVYFECVLYEKYIFHRVEKIEELLNF